MSLGAHRRRGLGGAGRRPDPAPAAGRGAATSTPRAASSASAGAGPTPRSPCARAGHDVALVRPGRRRRAWRSGCSPSSQEAGIDVSAVVRVDGEQHASLVLVDPEGERTIVNLHRCRESGPARPPGGARGGRPSTCAAATSTLTALLAEMAAAQPGGGPRAAARRRASRPAHVLVGSEVGPSPGLPGRPLGRGAGDRRPRAAARGGDARRARRRGRSARTSTSRVPAPRVTVVDTTAAGDVFAAGLVHALVEGRPTRAALETAVAWGAAAVACPGVPGRETIEGLR